MEDWAATFAFIHHVLLAAIFWASIGIYGSYFLLRTITYSRLDLDEAFDAIEPASGSPRKWIGYGSRTYEFPDSARSMRLYGLVICGLLGALAVLVSAALCVAGTSWTWPRQVATWILFAGPDWR